MLQMILVAAFLIAITTMACRPSATTSESDSGTSTQQPEASDPALLLSEESAISILQTFLQDCLHGWDSKYANRVEARMRSAAREAYYKENPRSRPSGRWAWMTPEPPLTFAPLQLSQLQLPPSEQEKRAWLMDLATGTSEGISWSAQYYGVTELGRTGYEIWVVIGPGLERAESQLVTPGRWKVYSELRGADYLDPPARLALEEYDSYDSCP